jgi:exopolysaccharide production protein ExoZ
MKPLLSIQYLRAFAALAVVAFHSGRATILGQAGVDVFFVLSGFLMWAVTAKAIGPLEFLHHRILRIVPLYWIATVAMAATLGAPIADTFRSLMFDPYRGSAGHLWPVLIQGWTLNYEMFFYAVFAATLFIPRRFRLIVLTAGLVGSSAAGLLFQPFNAVAETYTNPLLLEFLGGVWVAEACLHGKLPATGTAIALIVLGLAGFLISLFGVVPVTDRFIVWGIPSLLVVTGVITIEVRHGMPVIGPLRLLGDASYSIYLFHSFPVDTIARALAGSSAVVVVAAIVFAGAGLGLTAFYVIEKPLTGWLKDHLRVGPKLIVAA